jgi:hypothetical protein
LESLHPGKRQHWRSAQRERSWKHHRIHLGEKLLPPRRLAKPLEVGGRQCQLLLQRSTSQGYRSLGNVAIIRSDSDGFAEFP